MDDRYNKIVELLSDLGSTPEAVAESLRGRNCKGKKQLARCCPIANLVRTNLNLAENEALTVTIGGVLITNRYSENVIFVTTPDPVMNFISAFDGGKFPFLEEK